MPLSYYLSLFYPYTVYPDMENGGYTVIFDDLPGCMTIADLHSEISAMAEDARILWLETTYDLGQTIPLPFSTTRKDG